MDLPRAKKSLGQHWLSDTFTLEGIVDAADIVPGDNVLEIGPGTGTLTDVLIHKGAHVIALEFDLERISALEQKYAHRTSTDIVVHHGDIRSYDLATMPKGYKIVANIPYYLTANLLRKLVDTENKPICAALLVQKEVAHRVCERPGKLTLIAVLTQIFYSAQLGQVVPANLFMPPPKVDSQVLVLQQREQPLIKLESGGLKIIKAGFSQPRKKLRTSLSGDLGVAKSAIDELLVSANIASHARAQELGFADWERLLQQTEKYLTR
jgi:16S rRNA (adenine1518-N6/adenine1519-N6)-dimethyltransferase